MSAKRRRSLSSEQPIKVAKISESLHTMDEDEEDLESILEKIRQQEESEALAQKLQQEFENYENGDVIDLTNNGFATAGSSTLEGDEVMARRLAREWEQADQLENENPPQITGLKTSDSLMFQHRDLQFTNTSNEYQLNNSHHVEYSEEGATSLRNITDPKVDLIQHRELFTRSRDCVKCNNSVLSPRGLVVFSASVPPPSLLGLLHVVCDQCHQSYCRGCFRVLTCSSTCKGKTCNIDNCCTDIRAIALFEALGGLDREYIQDKDSLPNTLKGKPNAMKKHSKTNSVGPGGTGYSINPGRSSRQVNVSVEDKRRESIAARWDDILCRALDTITYLLPSPYVDGATSYDLLPNPAIRSLISVSCLPEIIGNLLVNDSVTDWTARSTVYNSVLKLLRRMVDSELTVGALIDQRWEKKCTHGLEDWMWGDGELEWEKTGEGDRILRAPPLYDRFKKLTKQCETFLAGISLLLQDGDDNETEDIIVKATSLCGDMISAQQDMQRVLSIIARDKFPVKSLKPGVNGRDDDKGKGKGNGNGKNPAVDMEKKYCTVCEELAFKHATLSSKKSDDGLAYHFYHYAANVRQTAKSTRHPAKRFHLIKELSSISTSLPPGVWVRVDEVRNDVLKIMIAGPEDTPYEGGLFEFDCFIPLEYPSCPPLFNLATTGNGRVRFNPNLYNCGKVCLSLLGTWNGSPEEQWNSKSTLLQVIVSIQSMILVEAPYFNEPGYGNVNLADKSSIAYNRNIALQTVHWAMVDWMQAENKTGLWAEVIRSHFMIRKDKILECIKKWAGDDAQFYNYPGGSGEHLDLLREFEKGCDLIKDWDV